MVQYNNGNIDERESINEKLVAIARLNATERVNPLVHIPSFPSNLVGKKRQKMDESNRLEGFNLAREAQGVGEVVYDNSFIQSGSTVSTEFKPFVSLPPGSGSGSGTLPPSSSTPTLPEHPLVSAVVPISLTSSGGAAGGEAEAGKVKNVVRHVPKPPSGPPPPTAFEQ
jgi:hypothetical protein